MKGHATKICLPFLKLVSLDFILTLDHVYSMTTRSRHIRSLPLLLLRTRACGRTREREIVWEKKRKGRRRTPLTMEIISIKRGIVRAREKEREKRLCERKTRKDGKKARKRRKREKERKGAREKRGKLRKDEEEEEEEGGEKERDYRERD